MNKNKVIRIFEEGKVSYYPINNANALDVLINKFNSPASLRVVIDSGNIQDKILFEHTLPEGADEKEEIAIFKLFAYTLEGELEDEDTKMINLKKIYDDVLKEKGGNK